MQIMSRNVIFLHIPKAAGTTLRSVIHRQYPDRQVHQIWSVPSLEESISEFKDLPPERRKEIRFLTGHGVFGLHSFLKGETEYVTMLRRPVSRVISNYYYVLRSPGHRLYKDVAEEGMTLHEYVSSGINRVLDNQMVRQVTGIGGDEDPGEEVLDQAKENLDMWFGVVGLVERFDESLVLMKERYGWGDVSYRKRKVASDRPGREDLSRALLRKIEERNRLDTELYEYGQKRLNRELSAADLSRELTSLRRKCWTRSKKAQLKEKVSEGLSFLGLR
jgi:hypothetical protein